MLRRIQNIWNPAHFHFHHQLGRSRGYFEGWYFKLVDPEGGQSYALIPGVFMGEDPHAFIQVLDGRVGSAVYHRFSIEAFEAARDRFSVSIGANHFSDSGILLEIQGGDTSPSGQEVKGQIEFGPWSPWPVTPLSPGIMGPYSFVPFMECNHGILSLDHGLQGHLNVDGLQTDFSGGRGYVEKDWGRSFPAGYVWTQSNHFETPGVSLSAAVARIPWLTGAFRGFIIGFLHEGTLHRFTTYTKSVLEKLEMTSSHLHLRIRNRDHRLEVMANKSEGGLLHAPYEKQMIERVAETMTSEVHVRLDQLAGERSLFEGVGRHACLEAQGDLSGILDE
ncbi:MAG: tocopherol cyclase family protein [Myxococcota bacterium]|nr:tocopherol cyclase family protein [Myxococcota bacterium]